MFPIHNKNRRIISFLAGFYRLLRFPIQSKNRRICSFQAGVYRFLWFPIQSKNNRFFRFLAGFYMFLYLQIQSNMRLKASCCFSKIKCPNASKSFRLYWFPIQSKNRRICNLSNKRLQVFVSSNPKQKYRFFRFLAGFYRFFCFPIQSNMRLKASCCFTKIKFPNASQSSLDHSKLTLTKLHYFKKNV